MSSLQVKKATIAQKSDFCGTCAFCSRGLREGSLVQARDRSSHWYDAKVISKEKAKKGWLINPFLF